MYELEKLKNKNNNTGKTICAYINIYVANEGRATKQQGGGAVGKKNSRMVMQRF